jgi:hypothetical protein
LAVSTLVGGISAAWLADGRGGGTRGMAGR